MFKHFSPTGISLILVIALEACVTMNIGSQTDFSNNFKDYHTFAWINRPKNHSHNDPMIDNDIVERNLESYVNQQLMERGYEVNNTTPDILLDYNIVTKNKVEQQEQPIYKTTRSRPYYYNPNKLYANQQFQQPTTYVAGYKTVKIPYEEGTVNIYIIDRVANRLVWQGWGVGTIVDASSFQNELPRDIKAIFKSYPISPLKKK